MAQTKHFRKYIFSLLSVAALLFSLWEYWHRQLQAPLADAERGGGIAMLGQFGGHLTGNDFLHIYLGSRLLWHGYDPYDPQTMLMAQQQLLGRGGMPYVYLPFTGFIMQPVSQLPYGDAFFCWFVFSHVLVLLTIPISLLALRMPLSMRNLSFGLLILAFSHPLWRSVSAGQLNAPLMLGYPLFHLLLNAVHPALSGMLGAGLMLFKLSPGILLVYLLWMRQWKQALWMAIWSVVFMLLAISVFGWPRHLAFLPVLSQMGYGRSTWAEFGQSFFSDPANQSFNSLFHHLFAPTPATHAPLLNLGAHFANAMTYAVSIILLGIVFAWTMKQRNTEDRLQHELNYSLFIFLSLLLPSLMWDHYVIQLFFPVMILYKGLQLRRSIALGILFLIGLALCTLPFNFWSETLRSGWRMLGMSIRLWGVLLLFAVNLALARMQPAEKA